MNLTELNAEILKDSKINPLDLENEIINTMKLFSKYLLLHQKYKIDLSRGYTKFNKLLLLKQKYYKGESKSYNEKPFNYIIKNSSELERYLDGDEEVAKIKEKIDILSSTVYTIEQMIETLKFRNNHINYIITLRKFEAGD